MSRSRRGSKGSKGIKLDLSGVEVSMKTIPEGDYLVVLNSADIETSRNSGGQYIKFEFEVAEGSYKGSKLWHNSSLQPQALFNLKSVLMALGFEIPDKAFELDLENLIGTTCGVAVTHEVYEGKNKARITEFFEEDSDEDYDDEDYDEDEEDEEDEEYDEEDDEDEEYDDWSIAELKAECKDRGIKLPKKVTKKRMVILLEEDDEE